MKRTLSASHPGNSSFFAPTGRYRADLFNMPAEKRTRFALSHAPTHPRWQAHGEVRSFHQAPVHISRKHGSG